jgi:hypothetical protein
MILNKCRKLTPNLNKKEKYIGHIENIKFYLEKGMKLINVHRAIEFNHSKWLQKYILKNSELRQNAKNSFEKDYFKLMNNSFYGKTMENVRDRTDVKICLDKDNFEKHTSCPLFANQINIIQADNMSLVRKHRKKVELNKPIYIGACILELSKLQMFHFHYDVMKKEYPDCLMLKTDTDSLLYLIETKDLYEDMKKSKRIQENIEFSNFPKNHMLYNCDRKKVPGLFQDECVDGQFCVISEYVGLRAKSYSNHLYNVDSCTYDDKKKSKGVPRKHIEKRITFNDYKNCLETGENKTLDNIYSFVVRNLTTFSSISSKIALSSTDDKRILCENRINTFAHGHYKTVK